MGIFHSKVSAIPDGAITGLVRPSDWNADHAIGALALPADISPTQLAADTHNWNPTGLSTAAVIRFTTDAIRALTGLAGGADGRIVYLLNVGSFPLILRHDSASSTAANRFLLPASIDVVVMPGSSVQLWYDSTSSRWRTAGVPVNPIVAALTSANEHAISSTTPTVVSGLTIAGVQPGSYALDYWLAYLSSAAGTGVTFDVNFSGTVTTFLWNQYFVGLIGTASDANADQDSILAAASVLNAFSSRAKGTAGRGVTLSVDAASPSLLLMRIEGLMIVTVAGNLELYHGSETAVSTTVAAGSSLILTKTG